MNALRVTLSVMFLLLPALLFGQGAARPDQNPTLCKVESLPSEIQNRLKEEYSSWKIQEPADLSQRAREAWKPEKPLGGWRTRNHRDEFGWRTLCVLRVRV